METHRKTRLDILIEAALRRRLVEMLDEHEVSGYTIFSAIGGRGESGVWMRAAQITDLDQMLLVICVIDAGRREPLLDALFERLGGHIGYVTSSDVEVIRPAKFP